MSSPRPDRIAIHGLQFVAPHGVYEEERQRGRRFKVDVTVELRPHKATTSDALYDTIDYTSLAAIILDIAYGPSVSLIEVLAERMASTILRTYASILSVDLTIYKHIPEMAGQPDWVSFSIFRTHP